MITISVIIPTYNRAHLVKEAIDSVIAQDIKGYNIEIIVVDDGSTDGTSDVIRKSGSDVKYIYQENSGAGMARNRGIDVARGDWIAFLDSDDRWLPYKLSLQVKVLEVFTGYKIIHSNFVTFDHAGIVYQKGLDYWAYWSHGYRDVRWSSIYTGKKLSSELNCYHNGGVFDIYFGNIFKSQLSGPHVSCWTALVSKECFSNGIRFAEEYRTWEDHWLFCQLTEKYDLIFMDIATAENRGHEGPRLTKLPAAERLRCHIDICERIYFPSRAVQRPSSADIVGQYKRLNTLLFKEYVKRGERDDATRILSTIKSCGIPIGNPTFLVYWLSLVSPVNLIGLLVSMKRCVGIIIRPYVEQFTKRV